MKGYTLSGGGTPETPLWSHDWQCTCDSGYTWSYPTSKPWSLLILDSVGAGAGTYAGVYDKANFAVGGRNFYQQAGDPTNKHVYFNEGQWHVGHYATSSNGGAQSVFTCDSPSASAASASVQTRAPPTDCIWTNVATDATLEVNTLGNGANECVLTAAPTPSPSQLPTPTPTLTPTPAPGSCVGLCGHTHAAKNCWCDSVCEAANDCCADYSLVCRLIDDTDVFSVTIAGDRVVNGTGRWFELNGLPTPSLKLRRKHQYIFEQLEGDVPLVFSDEAPMYSSAQQNIWHTGVRYFFNDQIVTYNAFKEILASGLLPTDRALVSLRVQMSTPSILYYFDPSPYAVRGGEMVVTSPPGTAHLQSVGKHRNSVSNGSPS